MLHKTSNRILLMTVLLQAAKPMRSIDLLRATGIRDDTLRSVIADVYNKAQISRIKQAGQGSHAYFMTPEQKDEWRKYAEMNIQIERPTIHIERLDVPARLRFLEMLADNPAIQDYAQLHNIIADYRRTLIVQRGQELVEEEVA